jgi:hypothetical protein
MNIADADLKFPVLVFTNKLEVLGATNLDELTHWHNRALANADQEVGMEFVDVEGKRFVVKDIRIVGERAPIPSIKVRKFLGWPIFYVANLIVDAASPLTLEETKARVARVIRDKPEIHCLNYSPENDAPEMAEQIAQIDDVDSLPQVLAELAAVHDRHELYQFSAIETLDEYSGPADMKLYRGTQKESEKAVKDLQEWPKYLPWSGGDPPKA